MANKYNKHYAVGMRANGSTIKRIAYPKDTQKKFEHWESPTRNGVEHMDIELVDGRWITSEDLQLGFDKETVEKLEQYISDIAGGVA